MTQNKISELALLCMNNDKELGAYLWDPVFYSKKVIPTDLLDSLNLVDDFLTQLSNDIKNINHDDFLHWIQRGWHKSLDYYVSSRGHDEFFDNPDLSKNKSAIKYQSHHCNDEKEVITIIRALLRRHTVRTFNNQAMKLTTLSKVLFENSLAEQELFGFEILFCIFNVSELMPGIYRLNNQNNSINCIKEGNYRTDICQALQGMVAPETANFSLFLVGQLDLLPSRFPGKKGLRDVYVESGKIAQKLIVKLTQLGLSCLETPAISDSAICSLLNLNQPSQYPLYSLTVGYEPEKGDK